MHFARQEETRASWAYVGLAIWAVLITLLLYGPAVKLPFFFDDLDLLPFAANTSLGTIWQTAGSFPYFRPFTTTVWRLVYLLFGELNSTALHAVNLLLHSLNGWLVGYLGLRLFEPNLLGRERPSSTQTRQTHHWDVAWLSSTLFLIFPFSFQAVPWVGSLSHLLVTTLLLSSLACFVRYYHHKHLGWALLSLLFTLLAPFAHENGIMALPIIAAYVWTRNGSGRPRFSLWRLSIWLLPLLLWFPVWYLAPKVKSDLVINSLETVMQNAAYFGQGIAYSFTWIGGWLRDRWGWNDLVTAVLLTVLAIAFILYVQAATKSREKQTRHLVVRWVQSPQTFPWFWCLLTTLPALFLLSFNYTISAPRLLVAPSVGISWLWGYTFAQLWRWWRDATHPSTNRWHQLAGLVGCLFLILTVGQNVQFVTRFMHYHTLLGDVTNQAVARVVEANENGRAAILINFPNEVRGHNTVYPLGHEGVLFLVDYLVEQQLIDIQTGRQTTFALLRYNDLWSNDRAYAYGLLGEGQSWAQLASENPQATVYLTTYTDDSIQLEPVGQLQPDISATAPAARFTEADTDQTITLNDGCVQAEANTLRVKLIWQVKEPPSFTTTIYVHAVDAQNQLVAQKDGFAFGGTYPMGEWHANTRLEDMRHIPFTEEYTAVYVGLYNWMTGERLTAVSLNNTPLSESGYQLPACSQ